MPFDPSQSFEVVDQPAQQPGFDPSQPFEEVTSGFDSNQPFEEIPDGPSVQPAYAAPGEQDTGKLPPSEFGMVNAEPTAEQVQQAGAQFQQGEAVKFEESGPIAIGEQPVQLPRFTEEGSGLRGVEDTGMGLAEWALNNPGEIMALFHPATAAAIAMRYTPEVATQWVKDMAKGVQGDNEASGRALAMLSLVAVPTAAKGAMKAIDAAKAADAVAAVRRGGYDALARLELDPAWSAQLTVKQEPIKPTLSTVAEKAREAGLPESAKTVEVLSGKKAEPPTAPKPPVASVEAATEAPKEAGAFDPAKPFEEVAPVEAAPEMVGMGEAVPAEFKPVSSTPTSIKNATVDQERVQRGLPPAVEPARKSFGAVWDEAMATIDRDPEVVDRLIKEIKTEPRALRDVEDAMLLHRQVDLQNEYGKATRDLAQAFDDKRAEDVVIQKRRVDDLSDKLQEIYDVGKTAGTETGRGLNARKMLANEDFTLASLTMQKRAANGGRPLTEAETVQITKLHDDYQTKIKALEEQVATAEKGKADAEMARALAEMQAEAAKQPTIPPQIMRIVERVGSVLDKRADMARERLRGKLFSLSPDVLVDLAEIGASNIYHIGMDTAKWTAKMIEDIGERVRPYLDQVWKESLKLVDSTTDELIKGAEKPKVKRAIRKQDQQEQQADLRAKIKAKVDGGELADIGPFVQKLARGFVESGIKEREPLIDAVHGVLREIVPDITRSDTRDAISGYGQFKQLTKDEVSVTLRDLKGQMQQLGKLEDMAKGVAPKRTGVEQRSPSDLEREFIKLVEEAKKKGGYTVTDPATQLASALSARKTYYRNRIEDLKREIAARERVVKERNLTPSDAELVKLKEEYAKVKAEHEKVFDDQAMRDLQAFKQRTQKRIADLEDRLKRGDFSKKKRREVKLDPEATKLQFELEEVKRRWYEELFQDKLKQRNLPQKIFGGIRETINTSRAVLTSADLSAVLRQGGIIALSHPIRASRSIVPMLKAFGSEKAQFEVMQEIRSRSNAPLYRQSGLYISEDKLSLSKMEEAYMSRWARKIPVVAGSERAYTTFLNKLRADSFDAMAKTLSRDGKLTLDEAKVIADYVNVATGRGTLGKMESAAVGLNTVFFAPKYVASRFQFLLGQPIRTSRVPYNGTRAARRLVATEYARFLGGVAFVYALGKLAGADIESDPRSSDFGKLRFGNTRLDPMAGLLQATVLLTRLTTGETKTVGGKVRPIRGEGVKFGGSTTQDVLARFLRSKLSPSIGTAVDISAGENVVGEPTTPLTIAQRLVVPLSMQDIYETMQEQGVPTATAMAILSIFGVGLQTYDVTERR